MSNLNNRVVAVLAAGSFALALMSAYRLGNEAGAARGETDCAVRQLELKTLLSEQVDKALRQSSKTKGGQ